MTLEGAHGHTHGRTQSSDDAVEVNAHAVIDLLRRRITGTATVADRTAKLGLVVQGGGMRTVTTAGMVMALEDVGAFDHLDALYGSSAGAFVTSYFAARQSHLGASIFIEDLSSPDFLDWRRPLRRRGPFMSLDYLCEEMSVRRKPLDISAVRAAPMHIIATSASTGLPVRLTPFGSDDEVIKALQATCSLPIFCGPPSPFRDDAYFDGGILESIPFRAAIEDGCTHILATVSTPWGGERGLTGVVHHALALVVRRRHSMVARSIIGRVAQYRADLELLQETTEQRDGSPAICAVAPRGTIMGPFERRQKQLKDGMANGYRSMRELLGDLPVDQASHQRTRQLFSI